LRAWPGETSCCKCPQNFAAAAPSIRQRFEQQQRGFAMQQNVIEKFIADSRRYLGC
jgi:hypothetical protein